MKSGRNDPCPCGSGKKYKKCCLAKDEAELRVFGDPRQIALADEWHVELIPMPGRIESDPSARCVVPMIMANGYLLSTELVNRPPADPDGAAKVLEEAIRSVARASGKIPASVLLRHPRVAVALGKRLERDGVRVRRAEVLPELQAAARDFSMQSRNGGHGIVAGHVETWSGWGLEAELIEAIFRAGAAFYRAAPWRELENDDLLTVTFPDGRVRYVCVLGNAGETFGLDLIENMDDFELMLSGDSAAIGHFCDEVIAFLFSRTDRTEKRMIDEIRRYGWEVAGSSAYPSMITFNTPGYGVSPEHAHDLRAILEGIPRFVAAWLKRPAPRQDSDEYGFEFEWRDDSSGIGYAICDGRE